MGLRLSRAGATWGKLDMNRLTSDAMDAMDTTRLRLLDSTTSIEWAHSRTIERAEVYPVPHTRTPDVAESSVGLELPSRSPSD
jgi:hypothetical protein